nr:hypothetical protein [Tanacetum cinerariifolium]
MPMDPLDPYVQLVMEAPPSPNYIPGPEAPPLPDYIPGPEYPEYLPPADDVLLDEEQPLPVTVSPTAESPGNITNSEPEMEPEEEDGDDEKSEGDSIEYPTSRGDDDADDLLEDDADEEEEEEHLALTIPAPALHSSIPAFEDSDETEPLEEGETAATPPPFGYRTPPLLSIPLPTSTFPLPLLLPSTSGSESTPETDMLLRKRGRFTTSTGGYEVGESSVAAAARQIRPALTVADSRRAKDRLIGRLRRERRYFHTLSTIYAQEKIAPKRARTTRANPNPTRTTTTTEPMTQEAINNLIAQRVTEALAKYETQRNSVFNGDASHTTRTGPKTVRPTRKCTYKDYLNYEPLKFNGTEGVI